MVPTVDIQLKLHSRLQAASYTSGGVNAQKLLEYMDKDNTGCIELDELR